MNKTRKQLLAHAYYEERKKIEAALHPNAFFNGLEVCHEHRGRKIVFTAWKGDVRANGLSFTMYRSVVLMCGDAFYDTFRAQFNWLTTGEQND